MSGKYVRSVAVKDNYIFAGTAYPDGGLFRSSDFGVTWTNLVPNSITNVYYIFVSGNVILVVDGASLIYYSNDNGESWHLQYQFGSYLISMAAIGNTILTARTSVRSTDNGLTWDHYTAPGLTYSLASLNGVFYAGTTSGIFKSTDFGDTWVPSNSGISNGTVQTLISNNGELFAGVINNPTAIYKSSDAGNSWVNSAQGLAPASSARSLVSKGQYVFAGMREDGIYRSPDNGDSWKKTDTGNVNLKNAIVFTMKVKNNALIAGTNKGMFRSTNNGNTWATITDGFPSGATYFAVFSITISGNNLVAAVQLDAPSFQSGIYYSTNDGLSWTLSNLSMGSVNAVGSNGLGTCLTVVSTIGTQNGLYRSTDNGITWVSNIFYFNYPDIFQIFGLGDKWLQSKTFSSSRSIDNGYTWFSSEVPGGSMFSFVQVGENNVFAGNTQGVSRTMDWGASWEIVSTGLPTVIDVEGLCANDRFLFAGTSDHAVWRRPLSDFGLTAVNGNFIVIPTEYSLSQNFPNPFNPKTIINYQCPANAHVELKIYDILGQVVETLVDENKNSGSYSVQFDGSNFSSGIYFYKLSAGNFVDTKRMILTK